MGRFNLLDERWIVVFTDEGEKKVSLLELFSHAHEYYGLAGEMKTQDFALMRVLLAVLHTVFSRFRPDGTPYDYFEIDPITMQQVSEIDEADIECYQDDLYETWYELWTAGRFPGIIGQYLEAWRERFYLFNDENAFMQVSKKDINEYAKGGSEIGGKNINRLISQSNNKVALFSPKHDIGKNREYLDYDAAVRWLITFHGYCGTGDKRKVNDTKLTCSKGWLYDLGGLYLQGANLFETFLLNCALAFNEMGNLYHAQIPSWERTMEENIELYFSAGVNNLASLYTAWARAIYIDPEYQENTPFSCFVGKLPEVNHVDEFLEPMTCWNYNQTGSNKGHYTPRKHRSGISLWRNFGIVMGIGTAVNGKEYRKAGILNWFKRVYDISRKSNQNISRQRIKVCAVSMLDDANATSRAPVDEICDDLSFEGLVLFDTDNDGWLLRINNTVEWTKRTVYAVLTPMLKDLSEIRGMKPDDMTLVNHGREQFYYLIDRPFRNWLDGITAEGSKEGKDLEWKSELKKCLRRFGEDIFRSGSPREFKGIKTGGEDKPVKIKNIATVYNDFIRNMNKQFK